MQMFERDSRSARSARRYVQLARLAGLRFLRQPLAIQAIAVIGVVALLALLGAAARAILQAVELEGAAARYRALGLPATTVPILIPVYSRPEYFRKMLAALRRNSRISEAVLVVSQDGAVPEISALIEAVDFAPVIHLRHAPPYLGVPSWFVRTDAPTASNVHFLLRFAFDFAFVPAAVVLEADIELSPDGYDFFRWAHAQVLASPDLRARVLTVNGYTETSSAAGDPFAFNASTPGFMVWGWLCPNSSWPSIKEGWTWFANWDITLEQHRRSTGRVSLAPLVSRTRNIGMQGINFNVHDAAEQQRWLTHYTPQAPIAYDGAVLRLVSS